ncbi:MAG TPA: regulatory protein RecX [Vicinamibacterales bacterium]|nr:regulatory protein RecX [Vicinamibacterales bacterium]
MSRRVPRSPDHPIARSPDRTAYVDALHLLGRRELSVHQLRERLRERDHSQDDIERAIGLLIENRALDDRRVAAAYVRSALAVKGRGRLRIQRELQAMGIDKEVAAEALAEGFGSVDERTLIARALKKKLRGKTTIATPAEYARVYQFLMRQGFSPGGITAALRAFRRGDFTDDH